MSSEIEKVFDFNFHLPIITSNNVNETIDQDLNLNEDKLNQGLDYYKSYLNKIKGFNLLLFNTDLFSNSISTFSKCLKNFNNVSMSSLIDFRRHDIYDYIDILVQKNIKAVMVNSYLQKISKRDLSLVLKVLKYCEKKNLIICIDGSYGTSKMLEFDNLKLMCNVAEIIKKSPIVIIHSGGLRIKQVLLLALENHNIYFDTSFSLPFYIDSSLEKDFAFTYKKIGTDRVFYGSDSPYLNFNSAFENHLNFFKKFKFSTSDIDKILYENALKFFGFE